MEEKEIEKTQEQLDNEYQYDNGFHPKEVVLKPNYVFYPRNIFYAILRRFTVLLSKFIFFFPKFFVWGYRLKGRKYKKYLKGSVLVCNHAFTFDAFCILTALWTKTIDVTTLQSNLGFGLASKYFRAGGVVPIPTDEALMIKFMKETKNILKTRHNVLVYPEAMLMPYCDHIRQFKQGAFYIALNGSSNKIMIAVHTFHKPKGLYKLVRRKKPCIHLNLLPPYEIKDIKNRRERLEVTQREIHQIMSDFFIKNSDYFYEK